MQDPGDWAERISDPPYCGRHRPGVGDVGLLVVDPDAQCRHPCEVGLDLLIRLSRRTAEDRHLDAELLADAQRSFGTDSFPPARDEDRVVDAEPRLATL